MFAIGVFLALVFLSDENCCIIPSNINKLSTELD